MQTRRTILSALGLFVVAQAMPAAARVGELLGDCRKRYGDPIAMRETGKITTRTYRKGKYLIDVYFVPRRFVLIYRTERAVGVAFRKSSGTGNDPLDEQELTTFLRANSRGRSWLPINLLFEAARQSSPTERDRLIEESRRYVMWKQPDGTVGVYDTKKRELVIRTPEMARVTSRKREQAPEELPLKGLDGF